MIPLGILTALSLALLIYFCFHFFISLAHFRSPVCLINQDRKIVRSNVPFKNFLKNELPGQSFMSLLPPLEKIDLSTDFVTVQTKKSTSFTVIVQPFDGERFLCSISDAICSKTDHSSLHRLIHDAKNPLATCSMALHNLHFITHQKDMAMPDQNALDEFLVPAQQAVEETTRRIQDVVIFSRTGHEKFLVANINETLEDVSVTLRDSIRIIPEFDQRLSFSMMDQQAMVLALQELIILCNSQSSAADVHLRTHYDSEKNPGKIQIEISSGPTNFSNPDNQEENTLNELEFPEDKKIHFQVAKTILQRHQSTLYGSYHQETGGYFIFSLQRIED